MLLYGLRPTGQRDQEQNKQEEAGRTTHCRSMGNGQPYFYPINPDFCPVVANLLGLYLFVSARRESC